MLENCTVDGQSGAEYAPSLVNTCITNIAKSASPTDALKVISQWKMSDLASQAFVEAMHTSLLRGARDGIRNELSGSLLRIRRVREEALGNRPLIENDLVWDGGADEPIDVEDGVECLVWQSVLNGTSTIAK